MDIFDNHVRLSDQHNTWASTFLILFICLVFFIAVGPVIGIIFALPFYTGGIMELTAALNAPQDNPDIKLPLFIIQGFATTVGLIVTPLFYLRLFEKINWTVFFKRTIALSPIIGTAIIVIVFMFVNSIFIEWNANIHFPAFLSGFEEWARGMEDRAAELTKFLISFENIGQLMVAGVVVAVLPAIGEELVFRGLIQNKLHMATRNVHLAIWISAFLFSAIHMQFFGFIPRMLLGALFGYLYYWSGNLFIPIFAHFINNGFTLLMSFLYQREVVSFDVESTEQVSIVSVIVFSLVTAALLFYFRKYFFIKRSMET